MQAIIFIFSSLIIIRNNPDLITHYLKLLLRALNLPANH
jgi:hypothetical protein